MRLLMLMVLSLWSNVAYSEEPGRFTFLGQNQCAPFEGVLFDPAATARILSERTTLNNECEIRLKYSIDSLSAQHALELQNLQIRHDSLINEYDMRVASLEREADSLANALKKQSQRNPALWVAAGIAGGIVMTYGAYRVFNE